MLGDNGRDGAGASRWPSRARASLAVLAWAALSLAGAPATVAASDSLDLSAYKGKVVYLDFWASWCGPCKESFPYMEELKSVYQKTGLVIVAVNVDHSRAKADAFLGAMNSTLNVVYDPSGALAKRYDVKDMPTSLLIGRDGRVRYVHKGFYPDQTSDYGSQVSELLNEH